MEYWKYNGKEMKELQDFPEECIGFIYKIENTTNGKYYIGRKQLKSITNRSIAKSTYDKLKAEGKNKEISRKTSKAKTKKAGKRVYNHRRKVVVETDWKDYTGSSDALNADIKKGDKISREILRLCSTKTEMTYHETTNILCSGCFEDPNCYNGWVSAKIRKDFLNK